MATNSMWHNEPDRLYQAKRQANAAKRRGEKTSAHSIMLSAYITALSGKPVERHHPFKFTILALWHTLFLLQGWKELNHNQLDVLVQFLLKFRSRLPLVTVAKPLRWYRWHSVLDRQIIRLAARESVLAHHDGVKPHQTALALITCAEVRYTVEFVSDLGKNGVESDIEQALALEDKIRAEEAQSMGLRQLVRIYRKVGELYAKPEFSCKRHYRVFSKIYLRKALKLAQGEADCQDQVPKIQAAMRA